MTAPTRPQHPLELAAELDMLLNDTCEYAGDLEGTPDELMDRLISIKFKAIHLRHTLRAQAEVGRGLRELVTQLMSDPWSYHYEGSGTTTRCVGCGEKKGAAHEHWCPIPSIAAALAQAGGQQV